ncbi:hypothetical protein OMK64_06525 [Cellulomonas fimi]|uniref:hypothetical protein n=1 Tax=Cellulomonas fimi TaxID=1708 RepID=UPI00234C25C0|nr:hypothetical protein [Cellulomonas fimi]MDC7121187.1 hypothetical protein [Cellulomonas fimi]
MRAPDGFHDVADGAGLHAPERSVVGADPADPADHDAAARGGSAGAEAAGRRSGAGATGAAADASGRDADGQPAGCCGQDEGAGPGVGVWAGAGDPGAGDGNDGRGAEPPPYDGPADGWA